MGTLKIGSTTINNVKLGSTQISKVYLGSNLIWSNSPYSTELQAIISRANSEGFSLPAASQLTSCDNLISSMKSAGIWTKQDRIYNFAYNNAPNLVKYSEDFDNTAWSKSNINVSGNTTTAPDSTMTADKIYENTTNSNHVIQQTFPCYTSTTYTLSFYLKAAEKTSAFVNFSDGNTGFLRTFNLTAGTVDNSTNTTITSVGSGWYYCVMTRTTGALGDILTPQFYAAAGTYSGDGVSGYYIWGVQIELGATATTYYKTPNLHLQNFSRIDWKNPSTSPLITLNGGMVYKETGFKGNGVDGYVDTGFVPSTDGVQYTLNNAGRTLMAYETASVGTVLDGNTSQTNNAMFLTSTASHRINTTNNITGGNVNLGGAGMTSIHRTDSTNLRFVKRTIESTGRTATSVALPSQSQLLLRNSTSYSDAGIATYMIGASLSLSEEITFRNDYNTYLSSIALTPNTIA